MKAVINCASTRMEHTSEKDLPQCAREAALESKLRILNHDKRARRFPVSQPQVRAARGGPRWRPHAHRCCAVDLRTRQ
eukprot:6172747-Pleurochrysis_carterae.AAC.7